MRYIVVDLEATCWENVREVERMEIIEIGAVELPASDADPTQPMREFSRFVHPVAHPVLSEFCRKLTSITQQQIDVADYFWTVFPAFIEWIGPEPFALCSWGAYDLNQLRTDCKRHKLEWPASLDNHINLKKEFARIQDCRPMGMASALRHAGIALAGTHHRGIDDARNIARLARLILPAIEAAPSASSSG